MKKPKWDINNIADQQGKVAVVTGASSGIGLETARVLAFKGATVILAVRNLEKGRMVAEKIKNEVKNGRGIATVKSPTSILPRPCKKSWTTGSIYNGGRCTSGLDCHGIATARIILAPGASWRSKAIPKK